MKLEQQVVSLELARQLKSLGCKQDSLFYWLRPLGDNGNPNGKYFLNWKDANDFCDDDSHDHKLISAFTVAELWQYIPPYVEGKGHIVIQKEGSGTYVYCLDDYKEPYIGDMRNDEQNLANFVARMLIWLIENKYLDPKD